MNKGIVLKLTNEYALVLAEDNAYHRIILKEGLSVGQKIFFLEEDLIVTALEGHETKPPLSVFWKKTASFSVMAACVLFFFLFGSFLGLPTGSNAYYAVVSVDINPSVELKINKERYVIGVDSLNEDGHKVSSQSIMGMKLEDAIGVIVKKSAKYQYLQVHDTVLLSAAINPDHNNLEGNTADYIENTEGLIGALEADLPDDYEYLFLPAEPEVYEKAKDQGISIGKYQATVLAKDTIKPEQVKEMKVKEILKDTEIQSELKEENPKKALWLDTKNTKTKNERENDREQKNKIEKYNEEDRNKDNQKARTKVNDDKEDVRQGKENEKRNDNGSEDSDTYRDNNSRYNKSNNQIIWYDEPRDKSKTRLITKKEQIPIMRILNTQ